MNESPHKVLLQEAPAKLLAVLEQIDQGSVASVYCMDGETEAQTPVGQGGEKQSPMCLSVRKQISLVHVDSIE